MTSTKPTTAMLHYTAPPVVGGVEAVIDAHARVFLQMDYPVSIIAGQGSEDSLPLASEYLFIPALDSQHRDILAAGAILEQGRVPQDFAALTKQLTEALAAQVSRFDNLIVHNVFTKHFNLPLTAAIFNLLDRGAIRNCIAWHHDFTWTSPRSGSKVHAGYPWDLLGLVTVLPAGCDPCDYLARATSGTRQPLPLSSRSDPHHLQWRILGETARVDGRWLGAYAKIGFTCRRSCDANACARNAGKKH
jgi:hypothetical protein